jgi:hypothetical protein
MIHPSFSTRRVRSSLIALTVALAITLTPAAGVLAGFSTSPRTPGIVATGASGTHTPDAALVSRKAGGGPKDYS